MGKRETSKHSRVLSLLLYACLFSFALEILDGNIGHLGNPKHIRQVKDQNIFLIEFEFVEHEDEYLSFDYFSTINQNLNIQKILSSECFITFQSICPLIPPPKNS